ncbi:zinc-binding alcohol dehydrogenase family protein [Dactylosporangium aurantiacum]|uniref:Zinc-type alcohol dehydrogenase-like protein n=1 Tax=Dactylosporangium aurantiacum TaxID=35754 RepID=A0A9Q9IGI8_9ACTN|nr:zinc-binding alcohol dehydrogenase family protein [Dactylosporangium aurantiacum]MDG6100807.1 zinc-binding alcohol dehydrogenase family protein [Dactylosporangium aurantiacum]UWZ55131.1 zinc-binding alcohol dehydrogenase family protein [Dactylosporangium aurantiacum]
MDTKMPAVISTAQGLRDVELPVPTPGARDLLVRVHAVSVNPVDHKVRRGGGDKVLGWDAAGVVVAVGSEVSLFTPGDEVYYAGSIDRPGTNARLHLVDERIVGHKPRSLSFAAAAALPLTTITAWETLFDRFRLDAGSTGTLLVLGAAGGVGSMVIQLARALTGLRVVGSASRDESRTWALDLGAHDVVGHDDLPEGVDYIFSPNTGAPGLIERFARILRPGGAITAIDEPEGLDLLPLKAKSISFHWELMFTRPLFQTPDMIAQHELLDRVADLVDAGTIRSTLTTQLSPIDAATLTRAHEMVEGGHMVGKVVVAEPLQ